jgi:hypothetical protein
LASNKGKSLPAADVQLFSLQNLPKMLKAQGRYADLDSLLTDFTYLQQKLEKQSLQEVISDYNVSYG